MTVAAVGGQERRASVAQAAGVSTVPSESSPLHQASASEAGPSTLPTDPADEEQDSPQEHFVKGPNGETRELPATEPQFASHAT